MIKSIQSAKRVRVLCMNRFEIRRTRGRILVKYTVGVVKAKALEKQGSQSIQDLRNCDNIHDYLNDVQIKGLHYYEDINQRIPRDEIHEHKQYLQNILSDIQF